MILRSLGTRSFRNLADATTSFHPLANIVVGANGQGKTNLLEAIYFLGTTKSFRTTRLAHLPARGLATVYVEGEVEEPSGVKRRQSVGLQLAPERRREILLNRQKVPLHRYLGLLPLFAYSSARLAIVKGGPDERRRFLDRGIASVDPAYLGALTRYARALRQRNALLAQIAGGSRRGADLEAWDRELVEAALPVVTARAAYTAGLAATRERIVREHGYHVEGLRLVYRPSGFEEDVSLEAGLAALRGVRRREAGAGHTLAGPHRDVLDILLGDEPATEILSSGEVKMTVLFLKLAKVELYREKTGGVPLFLLDDIDAELDLAVIERLLSYLIGTIQLFTTSPKDEFFDRFQLGSHRRFAASGGEIRVVAER